MRTMVKRFFLLEIASVMLGSAYMQAQVDTVRIDLSSLGQTVTQVDGWAFDEGTKTLTINGLEGVDAPSPVYLLAGDGTQKVEHVLLDSPGDSLSVVLGAQTSAWSCEFGYPLEITSSTRVGMQLAEGSLTNLQQTNPIAGAAVYNAGSLSISGTGELGLTSMGTAFYNEGGMCTIHSGRVYFEGGVALYLEGSSAFKLRDDAVARMNGDVGVYSNAHLDVREGSFVVYGLKEQLSTAVIEGEEAKLSGSLLQFTSTEEARAGGVTLELRSEDETIPVALEDNVISFALNVKPGTYQLIKPGTPDVVEQGVNEAGKTVTFFEAKEDCLTNYIEVEPATVTSVGSLTMEDPVKVFAAGEGWVVHLKQAEAIHVYTVRGTLLKTVAGAVGDTRIEVAEGIYFLRIGDQVYKVKR
ncbi:hypothetical protein [Parabacteroides sp.]